MGPALGHITRSLSIALQLRKTVEAEISFAVADRSLFLHVISEAGFEVEALKCERARGPSRVFQNEVERLLAARQFDLVVQDLNPILWTTAIAWPPVPRVVVTNVFLARATSYETVQSVRFQTQQQAINARRRAKGLTDLQTLEDLYEADRVCFTDPGIIVDQFGASKPHHRSCGACFLALPGTLPEELRTISRFVLASMGSTGRAQLGSSFFVKLASFSSSDTIIYAGPNPPDEFSSGLSYHSHPRLPLDQLLGRASIAVTQGGNGSTYQALSHGLPVVVVPSHANHRIVGDVVERLGAGICLDEGTGLSKIDGFDFGLISQRSQALAGSMALENGPQSVTECLMELL